MILRPFVLTALAFFGAIATASENPLADFARHVRYQDVKISPDGRHLAAGTIIDGKRHLSLIDLADGKAVNVLPRDREELYEFWWASSERVIYSGAVHAGGFDMPFLTGALAVVNADGKASRSLSGNAFVVGTPVQPDGTVLAQTFHRGSADGAFSEIVRIDEVKGPVDHFGEAPIRNARFLVAPDEQRMFAWAEDTDLRLSVFYKKGKGEKFNLVFPESGEHGRVVPLGFERAGTVLLGCAGKNGLAAVCRWNPQTDKFDTVPGSEGREATSVEYTFDGKGIFALRSMPGRPALILLEKEAPEAKLLTALMQQFPGDDIRFVSHTQDGTKVVIAVESDVNPGAFMLVDTQTRKITPLLEKAPWVDPTHMAGMEPIEFSARDGIPLHGYLTRPPGKETAKGLPLVVFVHGGPYGVRDSWGFDPIVQVLASRGYAVLQVNFRGSGGYGETFLRKGWREWGGAMQDDVTDATRWVIEQGYADAHRLCIFGASYGGYAALQGVVKEPDLYQCAIGYVGVYDLRLMFTRGDIPQSIYGDSYLKRVLGEDRDELLRRSPIANLDRIKAKVMLVVGGKDQRVPPVHGKNLHFALEKRHVEHEYLYESNEAHGFYDEEHVRNLYEKLIAFLDKNIGTAH
ncbi:MAG: S9 family peptidase [Tahibacter sp.]